MKFSASIHFQEGATWLSSANFSRNRSVAEQFVLRILKEKGPLSIPEIEDYADTCTPRTARAAVFSLAQSNAIYRTNPGLSGKGIRAIYAIKENDDA